MVNDKKKWVLKGVKAFLSLSIAASPLPLFAQDSCPRPYCEESCGISAWEYVGAGLLGAGLGAIAGAVAGNQSKGKGKHGRRGPSGFDGDPGVTGATGATGGDGAAGVTGPAGSTGATGPSAFTPDTGNSLTAEGTLILTLTAPDDLPGLMTITAVAVAPDGTSTPLGPSKDFTPGLAVNVTFPVTSIGSGTGNVAENGEYHLCIEITGTAPDALTIAALGSFTVAATHLGGTSTIIPFEGVELSFVAGPVSYEACTDFAYNSLMP